jgi:hypothetical protein
MRMHEVHRINTAKSMAGISHPGELTGDTRMTEARRAHGARVSLMVRIS